MILRDKKSVRKSSSCEGQGIRKRERQRDREDERETSKNDQT
jgi:hypothetical protein